MEWIIAFIVISFLFYVYNSGKQSSQHLGYKWKATLLNTETGEEVVQEFTSMDIFQGLRNMQKQGTGKAHKMASSFHPSLQDAMMTDAEKTIYTNPIFSRLHPPFEFQPNSDGSVPGIIKQFIEMMAEASGMEVVSIKHA